MLKQLREKKTMKRILWGLAILIVPAFMLWGVSSVIRDKSKGAAYAGKIYDRKVGWDEFRANLDAIKHQLHLTYGAKLREFINKIDLVEETWNRLILLEKAKESNIEISDQIVVQAIRSIKMFHQNNTFDQMLYHQILSQSLGTKPRNFEEEIRNTIAINQLTNAVTSQVFVIDEEVKSAYQEEYEKITAQYLVIGRNEFKYGIVPAEEDLKNYFDTYKGDFRLPESFNLNFISITYSEFKDQLEVTPEEIAAEKTGEETEEDLRVKIASRKSIQKADELSYELESLSYQEKSLEEIAQEMNRPINKTGYFTLDDAIPGIGYSQDITAKLKDMEPGDTTNLITTVTGYFVVRLVDKRPPYIPPYKEIKSKVETDFINKKAMELAKVKADDYYEKLSSLVSQGKTLEDTLKDIGMEIDRMTITRKQQYIPMVGISKTFASTTFALKDNELSKPVYCDAGWCLITVEERILVDEEKFAEEKDQFKRALLIQRQQEHFQEWFKHIKKEAKLISNVDDGKKED